VANGGETRWSHRHLGATCIRRGGGGGHAEAWVTRFLSAGVALGRQGSRTASRACLREREEGARRGAELGRQGSHSASRACLGWQTGPTKTHYYVAGISPFAPTNGVCFLSHNRVVDPANYIDLFWNVLEVF
jgi:hypothetical protein